MKELRLLWQLMKEYDRRASTVFVYSTAAVTLMLYMMGLRFHGYLPTFLFPLCIGVIIVTIFYQCLALELDRRFATTVLIEIAVSALLFHLVYQIPGYGLWGSDAYQDFASLKSIMETGFVRGDPAYVQITSYFPMIHVLGAQISLVTGIDPFSVAKWFPSVISVALIPLLYLLFKYVFKKEKVALLSTLLFASLQHQALFGSFFVRETIAVVLAVLCVYLYLSAESSNHPFAYRSLSILCLAGTILAHHLTSVMLILFIAIHFLVTGMAKLPAARKWYFGDQVVGENMSLSFLLIAVTGTATYWISTVILPLQILVSFLGDLLTPRTWGSGTYLQLTGMSGSLPSVRYYVLIYGSYLCYLIFGLLLLSRVRPRAGPGRIETYSFTFYLFICGLAGILSFFFLRRTVIGDRFLTFGWLFAFGPLVLTVVEARQKWLSILGVSLLVLFMFINLFTIHPTEWNPYSKGSSARASLEDVELASHFNFSVVKVIGRENNIADISLISNLNNLMAIYYTHNVLGQDVFSLSRATDLAQFDWVIVDRKGLDEEGLYSSYSLAAVSDMRRLDAEGSLLFNKNFESNNLAAFIQR